MKIWEGFTEEVMMELNREGWVRVPKTWKGMPGKGNTTDMEV